MQLFEFSYEPFQFNAYTSAEESNDKTLSMQIDSTSLYFENVEKKHKELAAEVDDTYTFLDRFFSVFGVHHQKPKQLYSEGWTEGLGCNVWVNTETLFGLGEREDTLVLKTTTDSEPYELWATDAPHMPNLPTTLYGQLPFVTSISDTLASAFAWINSSHTWVFIDEEDRYNTPGRSVNFVSESGALEFFLYSSAAPLDDGKMNRAKRMQRRLHTITGAPFLPPIHTLGFHFSKYAPASSDIIRQRNSDFTNYQFPVDVLWMDIQWADEDSQEAGYEYFRFNPQNFTTEGISLMN